MLETNIISSGQINYRTLARLVSNAGFSKLIASGGAKPFGKQVKKVMEKGGIQLPDKCSVKTLLDLSYYFLQNDYRHEYIYKIKILSDYILKKYSLEDTIILNEFRIGKSVADMILVNGNDKVFEIKTELDSPERLKTQLSDYYKGFSEVFIVTHHTLTTKYLSIIDEKIGIIEFDHDYNLKTVRNARADHSKLDNTTMMKSLRKGEFLDIVQKIFGELPTTTQVRLYKECLLLLESIEASTLQRYFLSALKSRIHPNNLLVNNNFIPDYLKLFCYLANFPENQYLAMPSRLSCLV